MSGGIAPSKSTAYVSNLPFSLTNNDLHKIFEKYGKVVKVTIMRDKQTHKSRGVAFVLFLERDSAHQCVRALHNTQMFGRTVKCKIATDNGRASDYIRRKVYKDKSRCYECGEEGHLSYKCPTNLFGDREPPEKKKKKRKGRDEADDNEDYYDDDDDEPTPRKPRLQPREDVDEGEGSEEEGEDPAQESLAAAISYQQSKNDEDDYRYRVATGDYPATSTSETVAKKKFKKDAYFSDEEEIEDD